MHRIVTCSDLLLHLATPILLILISTVIFVLNSFRIHYLKLFRCQQACSHSFYESLSKRIESQMLKP